MYRCTLSKARGLDRPEGDCASHRNMDQWLRAVHSVVPCQALDLSSVPVHKKKTRGSQESGKTSGALFIDGCGAPRRASYSRLLHWQDKRGGRYRKAQPEAQTAEGSEPLFGLNGQ